MLEKLKKDVRTCDILKIEVSCKDLDYTINLLQTALDEGVGYHVITLNPEMAVMAVMNDSFMKTVRSADLVVPDGIGVVIGAKLLSGKPEGRVPGIELATGLLSYSASAKKRVFFLGAKPGVAEMAAKNCMLKWDGLEIVGTHHGYFGEDKDHEVMSYVCESKPDIVLVAMGMGRQEKLISAYRHMIPSAIWIGVGGTLDVFAGNVKRAPVFYQKIGMEWFYRLITDPSRIKRMWAIPSFVFRVFKYKFFGKL